MARFDFSACLQGKWEDAVSADLSKYEECSWQNMRLPATVAPVLYDLSLQIDMKVRVLRTCLIGFQNFPSDDLTLLSMSVFPCDSRWEEPAKIIKIRTAFAETLCFAGAVCSQWVSHHHSQHDKGIALHSSACKGDDNLAPSH